VVLQTHWTFPVARRLFLFYLAAFINDAVLFPLLCPTLVPGALSDDARLTSVRRVHREYSWHPQLLEGALGAAG